MQYQPRVFMSLILSIFKFSQNPTSRSPSHQFCLLYTSVASAIFLWIFSKLCFIYILGRVQSLKLLYWSSSKEAKPERRRPRDSRAATQHWPTSGAPGHATPAARMATSWKAGPDTHWWGCKETGPSCTAGGDHGRWPLWKQAGVHPEARQNDMTPQSPLSHTRQRTEHRCSKKILYTGALCSTIQNS